MVYRDAEVVHRARNWLLPWHASINAAPQEYLAMVCAFVQKHDGKEREPGREVSARDLVH